MKKLQAFWLSMSLLACTELLAAGVTVQDPWIRATVPAQKVTGAFMQLKATDNATLVSASSPVAGVVEVHEMVMQDNVMRMRALAGLPLPAGKVVELKPGSYHIMLMDLKQPMKVGEMVPVTLTVNYPGKPSEQIELKVPVREMMARPADMPHHHQH